MGFSCKLQLLQEGKRNFPDMWQWCRTLLLSSLNGFSHIVAASNSASCSGVNGNISTLSDTIQFVMFNS